MKKIVSFLKGNEDYLYFAFRVLVGLMFMQHGAQKLFGAFGGNAVEYISLFGLAGFIEFFGGLMIAFGLLTRLAAFLGIANMLGAWAIVHIDKGFVPIVNGGELAAMFFAAFLVILAKGCGKAGLDNYFKKN